MLKVAGTTIWILWSQYTTVQHSAIVDKVTPVPIAALHSSEECEKVKEKMGAPFLRKNQANPFTCKSRVLPPEEKNGET